MSQKGISPLIITIIVAIVAISVGGFIATQTNIFPSPKSSPQPFDSAQGKPTTQPSPTTNPTANWKTYINNKSAYKYQVKYPSNWQLQETSPEYVTFYPPEVNLNAEGVGTIGAPPKIGIQVSTMSMSERPTGNESRQGIDFVTDWKRVNVDSVDGIYYQTHQCAPQCSSNTVLPLNNGQQSLVIAISSEAQRQGYAQIYNQILSTFKFLP
ncbi:MAG: PsbP-related protein [Candidatus Daviesbacteria bacterium]|nr:PsbP-related protein [Candidatus Daviesbacteria bacterium]